MTNKLLSICYSVALIFLLLGCATSRKTTVPETTGTTQKAAREFRAAWVATVANINWPSQPGLPVSKQKEEALALLDFLQDNHFNAVIFQVRPQADALYQSDLEPWSYYLTGVQGKAPEPFYDPLRFWIDEAHNRGLELHVWLNPYRAHHVAGGPVSEKSLVKKHPELVVHLKEGYWWFDPAKKGTQDHGVAVVMDLVKRYDIDGVHFDDYFYPYPSYNNGEDFPDDNSWNAYTQTGGKLSRGDWRRNSVNVFIERLYHDIKAAKPWVKFGLSPFGIWRPGYPAAVQGFDQYDQLYADARLWLNKGWIDYFTPQLYWPINRPAQSFPILLGWWSEENKQHRHLWPGISIGGDTSMATTVEVINKIMITRGMLPASNGIVHWSISSVTKNPRLTSNLANGPYLQEALVPASPWLDAVAPTSPVVSTSLMGDKIKINWTHPDSSDVFRWVVYYKYGSRYGYHILNRRDRVDHLAFQENNNTLDSVAVTAVDRTGNESPLHYTKPDIQAITPFVSIVPRNGWKANPPRPFKQQVPVRITIHHEGTQFDTSKNAARHIKNVQTWGMGKDRNWVDIPYHFLIAPDGTIYEGRDVYTVGETNTEYDPAGHLLISLLGNFEVQEVPAAQLDALTRLIAYASQRYNIPVSTIASHKDHSSQTSCPGKNLYRYLQNGYIKNTINSLIKPEKQ